MAQEYSFQDYSTCNTFGTVTLHPSLYELPSVDQYKKTLNAIYVLLKKRYPTCFLLVAELTDAGNIHYHFIAYGAEPDFDCMFMIDDFKAYNYKHKEKKLFGFTKIDTIKNLESSFVYVTKDTKKTNRIINAIPWHDHNKLNTIKKNKSIAKVIKKIDHETQQVYKIMQVDRNNYIDEQNTKQKARRFIIDIE